MKHVTKLPKIPARPIDGHKGLFGRVLVVGGNDVMLGAPVLAATTALRGGSGLVQIAVPKSIVQAALSITPELIGVIVTDANAMRQAVEKADVIVLGPGLGTSSASKQLVMRLVRQDKPMVIDADALNILASGARWPATFKASAILTPHPGEMKRLAKLIGRKDVPDDDEGRIEIAGEAARAFGGSIVVLKGHRTVVTDGQRYFLNDTGDSSLSKAGAGDVLSGLIGSIVGQQKQVDRFEAACVAVHLHGRAGEIAGEKWGRRSVLARDVIDAIPDAVAESET